MNSINQNVGRRIVLLRERLGLLQKDLSERSGLPNRTIGRIERGEVDARLSTLDRIAQALQTTLKDLIP